MRRTRQSPFRPLVSRSHTSRKTLKKSQLDSLPWHRHIERTNVVFVAVKDGLIAAHVLRDLGEDLDHAETEFLALHLTGDGNILDMPSTAHPAQKFAFDKDTT